LVRYLKNRKGQTSLEYLLLLTVAFITAYILIRGPFAVFARELLANILTGVQNVVSFAEWREEPLEPNDPEHPSNPARLKPQHL